MLRDAEGGGVVGRACNGLDIDGLSRLYLDRCRVAVNVDRVEAIEQISVSVIDVDRFARCSVGAVMVVNIQLAVLGGGVARPMYIRARRLLNAAVVALRTAMLSLVSPSSA